MATTQITFSSANQPPVAEGTCPDCGGTVPLRDGRIADHKVRIIRHGQEVDSDRPCTPETKEN